MAHGACPSVRKGASFVLLALFIISLSSAGAAASGQSGTNAIVEQFNKFFVPKDKADLRVQNFTEFLYHVLLPMGIVMLLIFISLENFGIGSGNTAGVISVLLGLLMLPSGVYQQIGMSFISQQAIQQGGLAPIQMVLGNMGKVIWIVIGFVIFEVGIKAGSFGGIVIGLFGLIMMFMSMQGFDKDQGYLDLTTLDIFGSLSIVMFGVLLFGGFWVMAKLAGRHHHP